MSDNTQTRVFHQQGRLALLGLALLMLSACASTITVKSDIPSPLVERIPLTAKMSYTDAFKQYTYKETEKGRSLKTMDFSLAQTTMFDTVFGRLLNLVSADSENVDLVIEPEILDFQYTAPRETKLNLYEVWLKYRLRLITGEDTKLADWTIKGYGKTPTATFTSASSAFNAATNVALRDVGAQLSIRMPNQSVVKGLLDSPNTTDDQSQVPVSGVPTYTPDGAAENTVTELESAITTQAADSDASEDQE